MSPFTHKTYTNERLREETLTTQVVHIQNLHKSPLNRVTSRLFGITEAAVAAHCYCQCNARASGNCVRGSDCCSCAYCPAGTPAPALVQALQ